MPSACLAGCPMEQDWAGRLMRGLTWGRNEVTFQEAEAKPSMHHFKRLTLLEKNQQGWIPAPNKKTGCTKGISGPSKGFQLPGPKGLKETSPSDSREPGPPSKSHRHHPPRTPFCLVPFPLLLPNSRESTGLSFRLSPLCACALSTYHIIN